MNAVPNQPERSEAGLAAAQARIRELEEKLCEAEQELDEATDIIKEQQVQIECQRTQLEEAGFTIDELTVTRRKLEERVADLEDELADEPCPVNAKEEGSKSAAALQFKPYPPAILKATPTDLAELEALVDKLGWEELMYRLGVIITRQAEETSGPHKGAMEAAANLVGLWGPSFHFCDEEVCRKLDEQERLRMSKRHTP
jgi:TolA-binding protein